MADVTTLPQMQSTTARIESFIAEALNTVAEAINEMEPNIENATSEKAGLMSAADKTKLDGIDLSGYVVKDGSKVLSTNDYTTAEKNKLSGIAANAQVNVIENITVDGVNQSISNKTVTLDLSDYVKNTEIASVLIYCGSVNTFSNLPANALVGDVYNIVTAGGTDANGTAIKAGDNVAYNGSGWDVLAGTIDLSGYVAKDGSKVLSTNDYTTAEKNKLSGIAANAQVNVIETVKVNNTALTPSNKAVNIDLSAYLKSADAASTYLGKNDKAASATSADTLTTRRVITISDNSVTNTGPGVYFSGGANITIKLPHTAVFNTLTVTNLILPTTASTTEGALWVDWS